MNFHIEQKVTPATAKRKLEAAEPVIALASDEKKSVKPTPSQVKAAIAAGVELAKSVGGTALVTIDGHASKTPGRAHNPAHITVTASAVDPKAS